MVVASGLMFYVCGETFRWILVAVGGPTGFDIRRRPSNGLASPPQLVSDRITASSPHPSGTAFKCNATGKRQELGWFLRASGLQLKPGTNIGMPILTTQPKLGLS